MPKALLTATPRSAAQRVAAFFAAAVLLASLAAPASAGERYWLVPDGAQLPTGTEILDRLEVAGALLVRSAVAVPGAVAADTPLGFNSLGMEDEATGTRLDSAVATSRANEVWPTTRGERAVVALVDTGVAPVPHLQGAVAGEIDFSGTGGGDGYGHGTFLASLIAGRGTTAPGVAPGAGILSLKVAGPDGSTDLYTVMSALQWLNGPGRASGIRVVALALGVDSGTQAAQLLDKAISHLASRGLLVVIAAGNEGPGALTSPATAPGGFSVGAVDDAGDGDRSNDTVAPFSADGPDRAGVAQPDAYASGVAVVGALPPDSSIARQNPSADLGGGLYRGSGTSMSTAVAAGVAALASSARPDLDGLALDRALRAGGGTIDAPSAVATASAAPQGKEFDKDSKERDKAGKGKGKAKDKDKDDDKGKDKDGNGKGGETDRWEPEAVRWGAVRWGAVRWGSVRWGSVRWGAVRWAAVRWAGTHWGDAQWDGGAWDGVRWAGNGWAGERWSSEAFGSVRWAGVRWAGLFG